jgi:hypothetical protein
MMEYSPNKIVTLKTLSLLTGKPAIYFRHLALRGRLEATQPDEYTWLTTPANFCKYVRTCANYCVLISTLDAEFRKTYAKELKIEAGELVSQP